MPNVMSSRELCRVAIRMGSTQGSARHITRTCIYIEYRSDPMFTLFQLLTYIKHWPNFDAITHNAFCI